MRLTVNISKTPAIQVGILSGPEISFTFNSGYKCFANEIEYNGKWSAEISGKEILLKGDSTEIRFGESPEFYPVDPSIASFTIHAVTIGINFHWQRDEDQSFRGSLKLLASENKITIVNVIGIEEYLKSVISSEMSASSSSELLKAHSVISRGWLIAQIEKRAEGSTDRESFPTDVRSDEEILKWYDREDHTDFDVCADDHCQRYQGITRASVPLVEEVIEATSGQVLTYNGTICDTRYYKCCGGVTELFENVWEPVNHPYLKRVTDSPENKSLNQPDLTDEDIAVEWIKARPEAFCNTSDREILGQVLNDYDQETLDFYRWKVTCSQKELSDLVRRKTGINLGTITSIEPLLRGVSGRIIKLRITGTEREVVIGKELEIRKALSESHLYSSCFYIEKVDRNGECSFILHGAGWGHGVGLCQIGAAVMGARGYSWKEILQHYFPGSVIEKRY